MKSLRIEIMKNYCEGQYKCRIGDISGSTTITGDIDEILDDIDKSIRELEN